ncbi:MAG: hypothetical protein JSV54_01625 [Chloroflexota bacterium]|nr:MAG: hypothetical protein JSV54_01625 [Chloroflexota bacterium]
MDLILIFAIAIFVIIILAAAIKIVSEYERGVVFRLGRCVGVRGPGLIFLIPFIERMVKVDVGGVVKGQRRRVETDAEGLIGQVAIAKTALAPEGAVLVEGELWTAVVDDGKVESGEEVTITKVQGLRLLVTQRKIKGRKRWI